LLEDSVSFDTFKDDFVNYINKSEIITEKIYFHEVRGTAYFSRISTPSNYFQT